MSASKRESYYLMMLFIAEHFASRGYVVHYMQSASTSSCYLKFDYGAGHSLRISDHKGKDTFDFRFNLVMDLDSPKDAALQQYQLDLPPPKYQRYYFHDDRLLELLDAIQKNMESKPFSEYQSYLSFCKSRFHAQARANSLSFAGRAKLYEPGEVYKHSLKASSFKTKDKLLPKIFL